MKKIRCTIRDSFGPIQRRQDFVASCFSGESFPDGTSLYFNSGWGDESPPEGSTYVLYSFYTPIAWLDKDGCAHWVARYFSSRTSRHQGQARWALRNDSDARPEAVAAAKAENQERVDAWAAHCVERRRQQQADYRARKRAEREREKERLVITAQLAADEEAAKRSILEPGSEWITAFGAGEEAIKQSLLTAAEGAIA